MGENYKVDLCLIVIIIFFNLFSQMEIKSIKEQLSITEILNYYDLKIKNKHINCPFHEDKTPSMQIFLDSNSVRCYSGNCSKSNKTIDVIDFIMHKENLSKHQALLKATSLIAVTVLDATSKDKPTELLNLKPIYEVLKSQLKRSRNAENYLRERGIYKLKEVGSNHRSGNDAIQYKYTHLKNCIVFPLKDRENSIVSFYGRSFKNEQRNKHFYTSNRRGLYPNYPSLEARQLVLTESIIDAATLQLHAKLPKHTEILACYGTNGFSQEHTEAVSQLKNIERILLFFDGDTAGRTATTKLKAQLKQAFPKITIGVINTPEDEDINSLWLNYEDSGIFTKLLKEIEIPKAPPPPKTKETKLEAPKTNQLIYLNRLIAKSGIIGEENSRLLLFIIASSYKTGKPLHAIVQGSSGSGKTHLISKIADMMPKEDVLKFTRITESALYNFGQDMLVRKVIVIEDLDGLKEEALLAFRELVSNHQVSSGVSIKDKKGNIKSTTKLVRGIFSSMTATTKGAIYEDNMNRSFLLAVDESAVQSSKIINYQNKRYAGEISKESEQQAQKELQQLIRNLQDIPVINPYATHLHLPDTVHKKRRLNEMFQSIIKQITFINQKQRPLKNGAIYTELEDVELAIEILFDSIILKIDELEGTQRVFYESLFKAFKNNQFTRFEAMAVTGLKKTQLQYHLNYLVELEYLQKFGFSNRGFKYKIGFENSIDTLRKTLKQHFTKQLGKLKDSMYPNTSEHQRTLPEHQTNTKIV